MAMIQNATPKAILKGIRDASGRPPVIEPEQVPSHLPHVFTFAERGPLEPQLVVGGSLTQTFGNKTLDLRGPYATHQSVLLSLVNAEGNSCMVQRVVPSDANGPATLALGLDLLEENIPVYERNTDGTYKLDTNGDKIPTGETVTGYTGMWKVAEVEVDKFGQAQVATGEQVDGEGTQSTFYPMFDLEVASIGKYGNNVGIRFSAPTTSSAIQADEETALDQNTFLYRAQLVERETESSSPRIIPTNFDEQYVDFSLKEGVVNERVGKDLYYPLAVLPQYEDLDTPGVTPKWAPFGRFHVYEDNVDTVLGMIYTKEVDYGDLPVDDQDGSEGYRHLINLFGAHDVTGVPYSSYRVKGPQDGGVLLSENSTHYARGGSDGTLSQENFSQLVGEICANYDSQPYPFMDLAQFPQSVIYDTGFPVETKEKLLYPIAVRKDIYVVLSTQDVSQPQLTPSEESSMAISLREAASAYPESEVFGTPTCRAIVIGHSGYLLNSSYRGLLPLTIEFAVKCARYMGAGNGRWASGLGFDVPGNNRVTMFRDINNLYKPDSVRNRDWDNGLVWAQRYDRRSSFIPAVQTVYNDDTSVLNSAITMIACVELEKVAFRVWRDLTGISYLTNGQFIERSDRLIEQNVRNRFDNRFVIESNTTITGNDEQRGFSWSTEITIYSANMKTVGSYTITSRRLDDLEAA